MTLENLKEALYLNNVILLNKIKALKDSIDDIISVDIETLKNLIDNINDNDISNINNKIDNINNTEIPNLKQSINDINNTKLVNLKQLIDDLTNDLSNHTSDTIIHVTQNDKDLWNAALQNAKDYAKKLFDSVTSFSIEIVESLPTKDIKSMTIYFIRNGRDNESDYYEEYMYINDKWEIIGSTFVNLTPYLLKEDFEKYQQEITDKFAKYNTSDEIANTLKDYLLIQTFNDTIKNYSTTSDINKILNDYAKKDDLHEHNNKDTLNKLSESPDGNLLFNGQEIKGGSGSDITISEEENNAIQQKDDGIFVEDKSEQINNISKKINNISIAQKTINGVTDYYFIGGMNPTNTNNTNNINITSNTSFIYSLKQVLSYEDNTGLKISDDGYVTLTEGSWDLTCGTLNAGNNYINFSWRDRNGNIYGNMGFVPGGSHSVYDLDSNAIITVSPGEILEIAPISQLDITVQSFFTFIKIIKISTREIDPVEHINTSQGIEDTPVGHIISHMGNNAPKHYLICDGTEYSITDYPHLAQHFKNEFGSYNYFGGDGINTFCVPELLEPSNKISPIMTSDTTPSPYKVTRSSVWNSTSGYAWKIFDGVKTGSEYYAWISAANELNPWICVDLGTKTKITSFKLWLDTGKNKFPENFTLQGSNDGTNFTNIKSFTNVSSMTQAFDGEIEFNLSKIAEYRYYKIYVDTLQITGGSTYVRIYEWEMFYQDPLHINYIKYEPTYYMTVGEYTVQGFEDYSEEEKVIGRWIDGRPLYQKTVDCGLLPNNTQKQVTCEIENLKQIVSLSGIANHINRKEYKHLPYVHNYTTYNILTEYRENYILINTTYDFSNYNGHVTIRYTKTTDKENSFTPDMLSSIVISGNKQEDLTKEELNNLITDTINLLNK